MQRDYGSAKENYDALARQYDEARLAASVEAGHQGENFRILDAAVPPEGPSDPNRLRLLLMGLLLAEHGIFSTVAGRNGVIIAIPTHTLLGILLVIAIRKSSRQESA